MGGYFSSVDLEMGVCIHLGTLEVQSFSGEIAGTAIGVCLLEASVSRGLTVVYYSALQV